MCSRYQIPLQHRQYVDQFGVTPAPGFLDQLRGGSKPGNEELVFPTQTSAFIRRPREYESGDDAVSPRELVPGVFGLLPHWAKDRSLALRTYNARTETVYKLPSFRSAWEKARHCIIPVASFIEPDWRSGKCIWTPLGRTDGRPAGLAGLWDTWHPLEGGVVYSFTMLTIPAAAHTLMRKYHRPEKEKRMVVVLREEEYDAWLDAPAEQARKFLVPYPADALMPFPPVDIAADRAASIMPAPSAFRPVQESLL